MIGPVAQLFAAIGLNTAGLEAGIAKSTGMLAATGPLAMAALAGGAVVAGVGVIATKMAGDFQSGITSLATGAGEDVKNLSMVSSGILQMAKDTGTTTSQLVAGMYMIESGGFHGAAGLKILQAAAEGAKVGSADLGTVADATDTILKNFGENGALSASQAVNVLITTVANGKTHLEDLANSLSGVLPAAAAAGLSLKDVMAAMSTLTGVGINAAESATYLRQTIISLEAPSSGAVTALKNIGISTDDLQAKLKQGLPQALELIRKQLDAHGLQQGSAGYVAAVREISGGMRQMQGMLNLIGGEGTTQDHLKTLEANVVKIGGAATATGNAVQGWALTQKTFNVQLARAGEVAQTLMIQLGQNLLPVGTHLFSFLADKAIPALKSFGDFLGSNSLGSTAFKVALIAVSGAIMANLVVAFVAWAAAAWTAAAGTIAATWPILAIGAAIALLVAGLVWAYQNWGWFHDAVDAARVGIGNLLGVIGPFIGAGLGAMGEAIGRLIPRIGDLMGRIGDFKDRIGDLLGFLGDLPGKVGSAFGAMFGAIGSSIGNFFNGVGTFIHNGLNAMVNIVANAINTVIGWFQTAYEHSYVFQAIVDFIVQEFNTARTFLGDVWTAITGFLIGAWTTISTHAVALWTTITGAISHELATARTIITTVWNAITGFLGGIWHAITGAASAAWDAFVGLIHGAVDRVKAPVTTVGNTITDFLGGLKDKLFDIGKNIIQGLINGIGSMLGALGNAIGNVAKKIGDGLHDLLGIHSPSTLTTFMGQMLGQGLVQGFLGVHVADQIKGHLQSIGQTSIEGLQAGVSGASNGQISVAGGSGAGGGSGTLQSEIAPLPASAGITVIVQPQAVTLNLDGKKAAQAIVPHIHSVIRNATGARNF